MYKGVVDGANTLKVFSSPVKIANLFNNACQIDILSGNEIATAVEWGQASQSPPRKGCQSNIPPDIFKAFTTALLTFSAIEQINCLDRTPWSELVSIVGSVLNKKREEDGDDPMHEVHFFC